MMDFDNILDIATQNQDDGGVKRKRYSLQVGPPKKVPMPKGVDPAAVQALLKKQSHDSRKKEIQMQKQKDELMAKRVELKSDRKARAMASRTKDNFRGYNGIPVVEVPKRRRSKQEMEQGAASKVDIFRNHSVDPEDDEDNYEYEQTDSEPEQEPEPVRPRKTIRLSESGNSGSSGKPFTKINRPPKSAPPPMNFAEILKLAEKKQFQPVELKSKPVQKEERLRTAEEIRELEMERKAKRLGKERDANTDRGRDSKSKSSSSLIRKAPSEIGQKNCKPQRNSLDKPNLPIGSEKKSLQIPVSNRSHSSSKPTVGNRERERPKTSCSDRDRSKTTVSGSFGSTNSKVEVKATSSQVSAKQVGPMPSSSHKSTSSELSFKKGISSLHPGRASSIPGTRPPGSAGQKSQHGSSQQTRPSQGIPLKRGLAVSSHKSEKGEPQRPGVNSAVKSSGNAVMRTSSGGPPRAGSQLQVRPGGTFKAKAGGIPQARPGGRGTQGHSGGSESRPPGTGPVQPGSGGLVPRRSTGSIGSGPGRPRCTVVSETISSKTLGGPRMGIPPRAGMPQRSEMSKRPGMPPRPIMNRSPGPLLPPITSAYKTKYDDEEEDFDSEMEDFIDDGGDGQEEVSKHIKEIFGYDRTKYRDESDYALKFMESSWKDMQKEEARSLKMAVLEDLEEEKREEQEERKRDAKRKKKD